MDFFIFKKNKNEILNFFPRFFSCKLYNLHWKNAFQNNSNTFSANFNLENYCSSYLKIFRYSKLSCATNFNHLTIYLN